MSDKPVISRRSILRGATVIAPTILTLHSGAALAKSSNLITSNSLTLPDNNTYKCLDAGSVFATGTDNQYDLGAPPQANITRINAGGEYHKLGDRSSNGIVSPQQMCTDGGTFERKNSSGGWSNVTVNKGGLVSATALSSFASGISYTDV